MHHIYKTKNVCSREIHFDLEGSTVHNIEFIGGCNGNLKAISTLLEGQSVAYIVEKLRGNSCGGRPTSCADQLSLAVEAALEGTLK